MILKFFEKNRIDFLKDQFKDINTDKFNILYNIDPTENKKYLQWILNQYKKGFVIDNNLRNHLIKFKGDDINKYNVNTLINKTDDKNNIQMIYSDSNLEIIQPITKEAFVKYGSKKWCISNSDKWYQSYTDKKIYFVNIYNKEIINKLLNKYNNESFLEVKNGEESKCKNEFSMKDFNLIGVCFYNGLEIWTSSNFLLEKYLNFNFLKDIGIEKIILKK